MKIFKTILPILIPFLIFSCGKNPERQARNLNNTASVVENNEGSQEGLIVNDSLGSKEVQTQDVQDNSEPQRQTPKLRELGKPQTFDWNSWLIIAVVSIILNVILLLLLVKTINAKDKYRRERNDIEIGKNKYKNKADRLSTKLDDYEKRNSRVLKKSRSNHINHDISTPNYERKKAPSYDDEKSPEISLSVNKTEPETSNSIKKPLTLFAEKANENKIFTSISDQKNEHKSIFKLILENADSEKAAFEIVDSDFILKMAANSPDTYLYPVCKPENSNQNYSGEIITTKRGIAHKVDGKWKVNEEDKATIKFQ